MEEQVTGTDEISSYFDVVETDARGRPILLEPLADAQGDLPALAKTFTGAVEVKNVPRLKSLKEIIGQKNAGQDNFLIKVSYQKPPVDPSSDRFSTPETFPVPGVFAL
ncbi:MAG: hypothetical protein IT559_04075 [Alphaproteobacteria bacterium]|nr:hypothetical protein [Alphaproteobacteria bacterium]